MAEADETNDDAQEKKGGKMKMIIFIVAGLAVFGGGGFTAMQFLSTDEPTEEEEAAEEAPAAPPIYQTLHPPMVVNVTDENGDAHFLQLTMEVMARDQNVINSVRDNQPVIRNALILHYGSTPYEEAKTREGKLAMLESGLAEIERVMVETTGEGGVEALYFTALVIQ